MATSSQHEERDRPNVPGLLRAVSRPQITKRASRVLRLSPKGGKPNDDESDSTLPSQEEKAKEENSSQDKETIGQKRYVKVKSPPLKGFVDETLLAEPTTTDKVMGAATKVTSTISRIGGETAHHTTAGVKTVLSAPVKLVQNIPVKESNSVETLREKFVRRGSDSSPKGVDAIAREVDDKSSINSGSIHEEALMVSEGDGSSSSSSSKGVATKVTSTIAKIGEGTLQHTTAGVKCVLTAPIKLIKHNSDVAFADTGSAKMFLKAGSDDLSSTSDGVSSETKMKRLSSSKRSKQESFHTSAGSFSEDDSPSTVSVATKVTSTFTKIGEGTRQQTTAGVKNMLGAHKKLSRHLPLSLKGVGRGKSKFRKGNGDDSLAGSNTSSTLDAASRAAKDDTGGERGYPFGFFGSISKVEGVFVLTFLVACSATYMTWTEIHLPFFVALSWAVVLFLLGYASSTRIAETTKEKDDEKDTMEKIERRKTVFLATGSGNKRQPLPHRPAGFWTALDSTPSKIEVCDTLKERVRKFTHTDSNSSLNNLCALRGMDMFLSEDPEEGLWENKLLARCGLRNKPTFVINVLFPWGSNVFYFELPPWVKKFEDITEKDNDPENVKALKRFLTGDVSYRSDRLFCVPVITDSSSALKMVVPQNKELKVCANKMPMTWAQQNEQIDRYGKTKSAILEVTLDCMGDKKVRGLVSFLRRYFSTTVCEAAIVIDRPKGSTDDEPAAFLDFVKWDRVDLADCPVLPQKDEQDSIRDQSMYITDG